MIERKILKVLLATSDEEEIILLLFRSRNFDFIWNSNWYDVSLEQYNEKQYLNAFRMSKLCFKRILKGLKLALNKKVCEKERKYFQMLLYYSMHNITVRNLAEKFGEPTTTTYRSITKVLKIFMTKMSDKFIRLPEISEMRALAAGFYKMNKLKGSILAVDGTHIPIQAPRTDSYTYVNRKGWFSPNFQLVADANYIIRDVFGGFAGSCHDARLYAVSSFKNYLNNLPKEFFVLGDLATRVQNT